MIYKDIEKYDESMENALPLFLLLSISFLIPTTLYYYQYLFSYFLQPWGICRESGGDASTFLILLPWAAHEPPSLRVFLYWGRAPRPLTWVIFSWGQVPRPSLFGAFHYQGQITDLPIIEYSLTEGKPLDLPSLAVFNLAYSLINHTENHDVAIKTRNKKDCGHVKYIWVKITLVKGYLVLKITLVKGYSVLLYKEHTLP